MGSSSILEATQNVTKNTSSEASINIDATIADISTDDVHPTPNLNDTVKRGLLGDAMRLSDLLASNHHTEAIDLMKVLIEQTRYHQSLLVSNFFPLTFKNFEIKESDDQGENILESHEGVVLLSRRYENPEEHAIDVNVVFDDPSIQEYVSVINSQQQVGRFEDAKVVLVSGRYKSLEKQSDIEKIIERNIVINDRILINIVSHGISDITMLNMFCSQINFASLESFLTK